MPTHRRYKAPAENRAVLADPPVDRWPALVEANRRRLDRTDVTIGGLPLRDLRVLARRELLDAARQYTESPPGGLSADRPLVLAGHQPELSHPGVWVKHFALNGLGRRLGGIPLNLVVDNDTLKSASLRLPVYDPRNPSAARTEPVPFDRFEAESPYEDRGVDDPELFHTFADRTAVVWKAWGYEPLLSKVWGEITTHPAPTIGERFAAARRRWERAWGCANFELSVSRLCRTRAFEAFLFHIGRDAARFAEVYNRAILAYRDAHRIRSAHHPAPLLEREEPRPGEPAGTVEIPLWYFLPPGRREKVRVWDCGEHLFADEAIRPRALALTLFARLVLGDFFVHGIGGGKYDEVTDRIIRDYFGVEPPRYAVLSATLHLPLPHFPHTAADARAVARRARDLYWNPQRYVDNDSGADRLRREKAALVAAEPPRSDRAARKRWFRDLQSVTERLRPLVVGQLDRTGRELSEARAEAHANAVLTRRDYAWVLYPEATLRPFLTRFL